jgi:leader peptidase (prepilin peptidase)/N-methyltransferase
MDAFDILYTTTAAIFGLILGSFYNVVGIRVVKKESIAYPPSHCVHCNHELKAIDLIPVISYAWLRGACRYCKVKISPIYPMGELLTAFTFALITWQIGPSPELAVGMFFVSILMICLVSDIRYMIIPDKVVIIGLIGGFILRLGIHPLPIWNYVLATFIGGGILYGIALASVLILKKEGMGGGDIKLFACIGMIIGIKLTLFTLFMASLLGTFYGIIQMLAGSYRRDQHLPFGPFIAAGAVISYLWGDTIVSSYLSLLN